MDRRNKMQINKFNLIHMIEPESDEYNALIIDEE